MLRFDIITLFPGLFEEFVNGLPFRKAIDLNVLNIYLHNLRDHAIDKHGTVDSRVYGGGVGMLLRIEPIDKALEMVKSDVPNTHVIVLTPKGNKLTQKKADELSKKEAITLVCGRYEGFDQRVVDNLADEALSIGDFVLSGGELPALVTMESITRLLPGVLEKEDATKIESFSNENTYEFPQYTRPEEYKGWKVPEVLLSGHHKLIEDWRKKNSEEIK
ncbi:MAG: tRNA (guanosine(37)-N1)-methyltransferase TrmD [Patescibacteria group bacterium]